MDRDSDVAVRLVEALATCNGMLIGLAQHLRVRHEVLEVSSDLECRRYRNGSTVTGYVDAELRNGRSLAWYLAIRWSGAEWTINTSIDLVDLQGSTTIHEFAERKAATFGDFIAALLDTTKELVAFDALKLRQVRG